MQGNVPGRASADYSWAFLLTSHYMHIASQLFPPSGSSGPLRFSRLECVKKYPLARKMPLSILYYLLIVRPAVKVLAPLSSSQLFRALITAQVKSVKPISSRLLRSLKERWRISPKTKIEIRSCHHTFSCLGYFLYLAPTNCTRTKTTGKIFHTLSGPHSTSLSQDAQKVRPLRQSFGKKFRNLLI